MEPDLVIPNTTYCISLTEAEDWHMHEMAQRFVIEPDALARIIFLAGLDAADRFAP
jgi:hypothetical protein